MNLPIPARAPLAPNRSPYGACPSMQSRPHQPLCFLGSSALVKTRHAHCESDPVAPPSPTRATRPNWTIVERLQDLDGVRAAWQHLRAAALLRPPNSDPDRYAVVMRHLPGSPRPYVALLQSGAANAIIIARQGLRRVTSKIGYLSFTSSHLRCLDVEYGGVITNGRAESTAAAGAFLADLLRSRSIEYLTINHLRSDDALLRHIPACHYTFEPHHQFALSPHNPDRTMAGFSKKHRYNLRRADRQLKDHLGGLELLVTTLESEVDAFLEAAWAVTGRSYHGALRIGLASFRPEFIRELLAAEARMGRLRCYLLVGRGQPIAYQVGCIYDDTFYLEATSFDPAFGVYSPGQVLLARVIEDLCHSGVATIDYGFGDADYKRIYGSSSWTEVTVQKYGRSFRAQRAACLSNFCTTAHRTARWVTTPLGGVRAIKRAWRNWVVRRSPANSRP